jgi:trimethylamine:corrinoid methyltransferase-like protein
MLKDYEQPFMDESIEEEMAAFIDKRKSEGGVKPT